MSLTEKHERLKEDKTVKFIEYFGVNYEHADKESLIRDVHALVIAQRLTPHEVGTLSAAWEEGMMESSDTPSKDARANLIQKGILCQTCWKKSGFSFSVTYPLGFKVIEALDIIGTAGEQGGES